MQDIKIKHAKLEKQYSGRDYHTGHFSEKTAKYIEKAMVQNMQPVRKTGNKRKGQEKNECQ